MGQRAMRVAHQQEPWWQIGLYGFLPLLLMVFLYVEGHPMYESNDDILIISLLSGQFGQPAQPDGIFLSLPYSALLYRLYQWKPAFPWYSAFLYFFQWTACALAMRMILNRSRDKAGNALLLVVFLSLYAYLFLRLNFASTSLFLWFVTCAYLAWLNLQGKPIRLREGGLGILLGISYHIRPDLLSLALLFSLPVGLTFFMPRGGKRMSTVAVPFLLLVVLAHLSLPGVPNGEERQQFWAFNQVRSSFMDTALGAPRPQTERALQQTGWSLDDYRMAKLWWLHDEDVFSREKMKAFLQYNTEGAAPAAYFSLQQAGQAGKELAPFLLLFLAGSLLLWRRKRLDAPSFNGKGKRRMALLSLIYLLGGTVLLSAVRFPHRVALPLFIYLLLSAQLLFPLLQGGRDNGANRSKGRWTSRILLAGSLVLLVAGLGWNGRQWAQEAAARETAKRTFEAAVQTVQAEVPDPFFLLLRSELTADTARPLLEFRDVARYRLFPASWTVRTPHYYAVLQQYGLKQGREVVPATVNRTNAVYVFFESGDYFRFSSFSRYFEQHIQEHYGALFPGHSLRAVPLLQQHVSLPDGQREGWVFFRLKTF